MRWDDLGGLSFGGFTDGRGWSYRFTIGDLRWLCPALVGESSNLLDQEAICATMLQRLYAVRGRGSIVARGGEVYPYSLWGMVRSYSQPVNPYWLEHGTPEQIAHRTEIQSMTPDDVPRETLQLAVRFVEGRLPVRPELVGLTDFAACDCAGCGVDVHGPAAMKVDSCFWRDPSWPSGLALANVPGQTTSVLVPLAVGAALAGIGLAVWRLS